MREKGYRKIRINLLEDGDGLRRSDAERVAELLVSAKADVELEDQGGMTALHIAAQEGHAEAVRERACAQ